MRQLTGRRPERLTAASADAFGYIWDLYFNVAEFGPFGQNPNAVGLTPDAQKELQQAAETYYVNH
eukprot:13327631-Alexandrium_andersonii.AAC.1